jgi:hypothetical protein
MPFPLVPLAIAGAGLAFNALFKPGQTRMERRDFDYDPQGQARQAYDRVTADNFGLGEYERMAARGSQGAAALGRLAVQRGGSFGQVDALQRDAADQSSARALDGYGQFRQGTEQLAQGYLGMDQQRMRFITEGLAQQRMQNAGASAGFQNQLFSGLSFMAGNGAFGSFGKQNGPTSAPMGAGRGSTSDGYLSGGGYSQPSMRFMPSGYAGGPGPLNLPYVR